MDLGKCVLIRHKWENVPVLPIKLGRCAPFKGYSIMYYVSWPFPAWKTDGEEGKCQCAGWWGRRHHGLTGPTRSSCPTPRCSLVHTDYVQHISRVLWFITPWWERISREEVFLNEIWNVFFCLFLCFKAWSCFVLVCFHISIKQSLGKECF